MSHDLVERALDWVRDHPLPNGHVVPICLWGPRGVGKTKFIESYCAERGYGLRGYQPSHDEDGSGLVGLPKINESTGKVDYAPPPFLPSMQLAGTALQEDRGVIFYDEINRGSQRARNALMEPIDSDRISRSGWMAPKGWVPVAAANPPEPGYDVEEMDEALMNRMVHIWVRADKKAWTGWARGHRVPLDEGVVSFAFENFEQLASERVDLPDTIRIPMTPRSMEYLGRLYEPGMDRDLLEALAVGLIGKEPGKQFVTHIAEYEARELQPAAAQLTPEHILKGGFEGPLAADLAAGNERRVKAASVALAKGVAKHKPTPQYAANIAAFMRQLSAQLAKFVAHTMHEHAPQWTEPVMAAYHGKHQPAH